MRSGVAAFSPEGMLAHSQLGRVSPSFAIVCESARMTANAGGKREGRRRWNKREEVTDEKRRTKETEKHVRKEMTREDAL